MKLGSYGVWLCEFARQGAEWRRGKEEKHEIWSELAFD